MSQYIGHHEAWREEKERANAAEDRVAELEAQCVAMREALKAVFVCRHTTSQGCVHWDAAQSALAPDAGKQLLERLERAEAENRECKRQTAIDRAQALEEAAQLAEAHESSLNRLGGGFYEDDVRRNKMRGQEIAEAIRALAELKEGA